VHEAPGDLQEEQADRQLHAAHECTRECAPGKIDKPELPAGEEDHPHQQRSGGDFVLAQPLRDRDCAKCLQRLHRDRQPVEERGRDVEKPGRQQHRGRREPVLHDEGDRDRDQHT
jgi:hypothetical protein